MQKNLFQEKINYLFETFKKANICNDERALVELFSKGGIYSDARKKTVIEKWLNGEMKQPPKRILFLFADYPISYKFKLSNDKNAFSKESFLNNSFSFESFKKEVDGYITYKNRPIALLEYNYIYYYHRKKDKLVYVKLEAEEQLDDNLYKIKITLFSSSGKSIEPYRGTLEINNERYYISVKNHIEVLTLYFVLGRGYTDNSKVYGIGLGISQQGGLVEATKEIMTKNLLDKEGKEEAKLYLSTNESEYLLADEILLKDIYPTLKDMYINKLNNKFNNLTTFIKNSRDSLALENSIGRDPYLNIFYKSFIGLNEISKKVTQNQSYFVNRRRPVMKNFFRTIANRKNSSCTMVYPTFKNASVIFDKNDDESRKFLNTCVELSKNGLEIYMIFIVGNKSKVTKYFKRAVSNLIENKINVKIAFIEDIDNIRVSSYDFIYSKEKDVAVYTNFRDRIRMFKVTKIKEKIEKLVFDYRKIEDISFELDELENKKEFIKDEFLERLVGSWNLYFYSSIKKNNQHKVWQNKIEIYKDSSVKYLWNNESVLEGFINTIFNKEKVVIYLNHLETETLTIITFKKNKIHQNIFKVTIIDSQAVDTNYDMASFGILSKVEQSEELIRDTLGDDMSKIMLCEDSQLERDITKIYTESKF